MPVGLQHLRDGFEVRTYSTSGVPSLRIYAEFCFLGCGLAITGAPSLSLPCHNSYKQFKEEVSSEGWRLHRMVSG